MDKVFELRREMVLVPIGKVLVDILNEIAVALRKTYNLHVRIGRLEEPATNMYSDERRQYSAERLVTLLTERKRENLLAVLGVVDADIFFGEKSFIFGMNQPGKGIALVSLTRLREDFYKKPSDTELFLQRAVTESIYQVGLAMGLPACPQKKCVLSPASTLWRLNEKKQSFCELCQPRVNHLLSSPKPARSLEKPSSAPTSSLKIASTASPEQISAGADTELGESQTPKV